MKVIIDIPKEVKTLFDNADISDLRDFYDFNSTIGKAIINCTILPKHHGDLIDADELEPDTEWDDYEDGFISYSRNQIKCANVIIPADKEND